MPAATGRLSRGDNMLAATGRLRRRDDVPAATKHLCSKDDVPVATGHLRRRDNVRAATDGGGEHLLQREESDISALVADKGFASLRSPIKMVTGPHTPIPFSPPLEDAFIPDPEQIVEAVKSQFENATA